ncbi:CLUMA_CG012429, isoform A [Clunio marinus]|uniref:CLUMA_CG012429, isoform A n=1 Tax=Clunio marinus TaxID=568069 RepID=A0A1J1IFF2_9DIPT|nr:CLUMA_CG012429, isoform A [Clunio marinus]
MFVVREIRVFYLLFVRNTSLYKAEEFERTQRNIFHQKSIIFSLLFLHFCYDMKNDRKKTFSQPMTPTHNLSF